MANHVRSRVEVESNSKEIHEYLQRFDDSCTGLGNRESCPNTCKVVFGEDWKYNIDDVGSKWVFVEETPYWNKSEDSTDYTDEMVVCSAWHFPLEFFESLTENLAKISDDFELVVTADEESEDFVGGGVGNKNGFEYVEDDDIEPLDWDNEDDSYRDEHWDMIDGAKSQCIADARQNLSDLE